MTKTFPYRIGFRQHVEYDLWLDQRAPLRPGRADHVTFSGGDGFVRFLCPCGNGTEVILNTRMPNQSPYYTFFETAAGFLTVSEKIQTNHACSFWVKDGEIIDFQE